MVEAPRIRIFYDNLKCIKGKKIKNISGTSYLKYNIDLHNYYVKNIWFAGKYLYIHLIDSLTNSKIDYFIRTHFMMYGKIVLNDKTKLDTKPFMTIIFDNNDTIKWYMSQITVLDPKSNILIKTNYCDDCTHGFTTVNIINSSLKMRKYDISSRSYNTTLHCDYIKKEVIKNSNTDTIITDFLLNQKYFPGVGNILQQEALYSCKINPKYCIDNITDESIDCLISSLYTICNNLYNAYMSNTPGRSLMKIYHKAYCPLNHKTVTKYIGKRNRRVTWCEICQSNNVIN